MARVVQQRPGPPYLLIIVVFLFLTATTLAVLQFMQADKVKKENTTLKSTINNLASPEERSSGLIQKMIDARQESTDGMRATVVGQFAQREAALVQAIDPTAASYQVALDKAGAAAGKIGSRRGLVVELLQAHDQLVQKDKQVDGLKKEADTLQQKIRDKDKAANAQTKRFDEERNDLKNKVRELEEQLSSEQTGHEKQQRAIRSEYNDKIAELNKNIAAKAQQIQEFQGDAQRLKRINSKLSDQVKDLLKPKIGAINVARQPDGKVQKVLQDQEVVYINIGSKDRVVPGLTFSVYLPGGIPETGEGKGSIIVTNVSENISECRISSQKADDPIVEGDLVGNLAFDTLQTYTFVVEGHFDLYAEGEASITGAEKVKAMIKKSGGKLVDKVDVNTDFVVMGQEPPRPARPSENAPPQDWKVYQEWMKIYNHYGDVKLMAQTMHIPVLNTNRFLAFLGRTSSKTLRK
ncbi:MAG: hypothetical protein SVT52_08510 [Planctomycetota bacterium]|nr:hypothetical protein [Planctomycetota bacterium]